MGHVQSKSIRKSKNIGSINYPSDYESPTHYESSATGCLPSPNSVIVTTTHESRVHTKCSKAPHLSHTSHTPTYGGLPSSGNTGPRSQSTSSVNHIDDDDDANYNRGAPGALVFRPISISDRTSEPEYGSIPPPECIDDAQNSKPRPPSRPFSKESSVFQLFSSPVPSKANPSEASTEPLPPGNPQVNSQPANTTIDSPEIQKLLELLFEFSPELGDKLDTKSLISFSMNSLNVFCDSSLNRINGTLSVSIPSFLFEFRPKTFWAHYSSLQVYPVLMRTQPAHVDLHLSASDLSKQSANVTAYELKGVNFANSSPEPASQPNTSELSADSSRTLGPSPSHPQVPHPTPVPPQNPTPAPKPPIMTSAFDFVKISPSIFEILRMSMYDDFFSMGPVKPDLAQPIHVFKATFSSVQLALAGFFFDSLLRIRCSGCKEFDMSPIDAFLPWDLYSQRCRREWRNLLNTLCDEPRHGANCFWTQQLRNARETGSTAGASGTSNDATSSQIDYRSTLVLSLQEPAERTEFTRELVDRPVYSEELVGIHQIRNWLQFYKASPESATNSLSRLLSVTHEQLEKVKMLYLMPHNTEPLPSANTQPGQPPPRRPLTMGEAQAIIKVVDFKRDPPREAKQREAETMRFAMKRFDSFMNLELFSRSAAGRKFALYAAQRGYFLSSQAENTPQTTEYRVTSAFRELRINCSFCLRDRKSTRLNSSHAELSRMPSSA